MTAEILSFETGRPAELTDGEPSLVVDVEGYEGPLDLLLALARQQKVDLAKISILALADQYLHFIEAARKIRLELAADYLVMAAWLAFLKSRLLLPEPATADGPSAEEMATALANSRWVPKGLYDRAVNALGHVGITDAITLMGYYTSVSMTLAFYDVPAGAPGMAR